MTHFKGKICVITGASSGIGKECALAFASQGCHIVLVARNAEKLRKAEKDVLSRGVETLSVVADVSKELDCKNIIDESIERFGKIDILINNAGVSMRAMLGEVEMSVLHTVMDTNFWGTVYCTKYALPYLLKSKGSIIGMISIAGFRGLPGRTAYSASKFAVSGFLEVLRTEHFYDGLHVLLAAPGFTATNIRFEALTADGSRQVDSPRAEHKMMKPEVVAHKILKATKKRRRYVIMSSFDFMVVWVNRFFPRFADRMTYWYMAKETDSPFT